MSCILLIRIPYAIPDWLPVFAGIALPVILMALYIIWIFKKEKKLSPEQKQDYKDATKSILEHPAIALLKKQGWEYMGDASEMEM